MIDVHAPAGWAVAALDDLVEILDSRRIPVSAKERAARPGTVPYYGATGPVGTIDRVMFDEDLVLLGEDGVQFFDPGKAKAYRISGPAWVNNHAHVLRAGAQIDWRFLAHYLNQFDYHGYANGTTRLKLTQGAMKRIPISYPSLDEQRRIVDTLEDHISRLDAGKHLLMSVSKRGVMLELAALDALVPDGWPSVLMKDLAVSSGYGTSTKCVVDGPGMPVARIPNVVGGVLDMTDEKRAADPSVDLSRLMLEEGDVLFVRTNGSRELIGRTAVVQQDLQVSFASYLIRYQVDQATVDPTWIHLMMSRASARAEIERLASSSAGQHNLSLGKIDRLRVPVPDLAAQRRLIEQYRASLDGPQRLIKEAKVALRRVASLRRSLLAAAFSGRLTQQSIPASEEGSSDAEVEAA